MRTEPVPTSTGPVMNNIAKLFTTVGIALIVNASHAKADDSWFVYCEGVENGQNTAYLTTALYSHYKSAAHKAELENAAMQRLSATRKAPVYGCSGVNFTSKASATQARTRTAEIHKMVGNKVVMFDMDAPQPVRLTSRSALKRARISRSHTVAMNTTFAAGPDSR